MIGERLQDLDDVADLDRIRLGAEREREVLGSLAGSSARCIAERPSSRCASATHGLLLGAPRASGPRPHRAHAATPLRRAGRCGRAASPGIAGQDLGDERRRVEYETDALIAELGGARRSHAPSSASVPSALMTMSCWPTRRSTTKPTLAFGHGRDRRRGSRPAEARTRTAGGGRRLRVLVEPDAGADGPRAETPSPDRASGSVAPRCVITSRSSKVRTIDSSKTMASSTLASGMQNVCSRPRRSAR